ncbi:MAG: NAD(P)-binding protein [Oscillatoria sp. SIO1A7]|nr:NAD(P)-binding protein [Oscillatoria sp. SIO1A7]
MNEQEETRQEKKSKLAVVKKVAIAGGGIGGLATAIALRKQGIDAQIYERARELRPVGAGLSLLPNGLKALEGIEPGIVARLKQAGSQGEIINLQNKSGETILQNKSVLMEKYGMPMLNIRWSRLQEILASALPPDIIHLNHRCIGFEQDRDRVTVNFENGKTAEADFLVGADGINSAVRQILIGDGSPRYGGRMSWRAVIQYSHELLRANEVILMTAVEGKNIALIDVGGGYIFWSAGALSADDSSSGNAAAVKSRVSQEFAGWASPVPEIIEATDAEAIVERPIWDRPPVSSWSQGRVTLLGDAAHPMAPSLGQGASTAFEDARILALCIGSASSLESAIASYETARIERTKIIQARSAFVGLRSYDPDSEKYFEEDFSGVAERAKVGNEEFEEWLYRYECDAIGQTLAS